MQNFVGIVRTGAELEKVEAFLKKAQASLECHVLESVEDFEIRNILQVALLIVQSAQLRKESRGLHYTLDYPEPVESERHDTILKRNP